MTIVRLCFLAFFLADVSAIAQTAPPLPEKLAGAAMFSGTRRGTVIPIELSQIKQEGANVKGVISRFRTNNGQCEANDTPFTGTYANGVLKIKSARLDSKQANGSCAAMSIDASYVNGALSGTYEIGQSANRFSVEFPIK